MLLPQTGVVTDGDRQQAGRRSKSKSAQWFLKRGARGRQVLRQLHKHVSALPLSLSLSPADGEGEPPHSLAGLTTTCVAWRGRELSIINLSTSLTAH